MGRLLKTYQRKQIIHAPVIDCKCIYYTHSTPFAISYQDQTNVVYQDPPYLARPLMKKKIRGQLCTDSSEAWHTTETESPLTK